MPGSHQWVTCHYDNEKGAERDAGPGPPHHRGRVAVRVEAGRLQRQQRGGPLAPLLLMLQPLAQARMHRRLQHTTISVGGAALGHDSLGVSHAPTRVTACSRGGPTGEGGFRD